MPTVFRVTLPVPDLYAAVHFYSALFGIDGEELVPGMHAFRFNGATLVLLESGVPAHGEPIAVAVEESLTQLHYRAQSIGASHVDAEPRTMDTGEYGFLVKDPFGNALYVIDQRSVAWQPQTQGASAAAPPETAAAGQLALERDFINAVKGGDLEAVEEFLSLDPELVEATDSAGVSAMLLAAYKGHTAVAEHLRQMNPDPNLWEAAAFGLKDRITELLDTGFRVNIFSADGFTPLGLACFFGHPECVLTLLKRGADPNLAAQNDMKVQALHSAVARVPEAVAFANVRALITAGANVNATQQGGYTALHQAADRGHASVVKLLLDAGARREAAAANGRTPADLARAKRHANVVALLHGAG